MDKSVNKIDCQNIYGEKYYDHYCGGIPYDRSEPIWNLHFGNVADKIIEGIKPRRVLDIGCAKGLLVEALRDRGVEAYGVDISMYAISQVREDIKHFCKVGSALGPIDGEYDLITCFEVLEHLREEEARTAISNMSTKTSAILFSSTPSDYHEPTHINVQPIIYWLELFSEYGFYPDITFNAGFVAPWAFLLRKKISAQERDSLRIFAFLIDKKIELVDKDKLIRELRGTVQSQEQQLKNIQESPGWKLLQKGNRVKDTIFPIHTKRRRIYNLIFKSVRTITNEGSKAFLRKSKNEMAQRIRKKEPYELWILKNEPNRTQLKAMQIESKSWPYRPKISIVTPAYNTGKHDLSKCIQSVLDQIYDNWELCIVDGGSGKDHVKKIIGKFAVRESRIKFSVLSQNYGIAGNSNEALKLASGEYIGFLDHDDILAPFALYEVVKLLNRERALDFIYSDEDKISADGKKRYEPFFKPEWSPDTFLSCNYICHFSVIRKTIIDKVRGFREGYNGSQDYDLFLRVIQNSVNIKRIPKILYHWRALQGSAASDINAKPYAHLAAKKAISEYLQDRGLEAEVLDGVFLGSYKVKYKISPAQEVCIIIPTRDRVDLLKRCISSICSKTDYKGFKILIVDNQSKEQETHDFYNSIKNDRRLKILQYDNPFNYSVINNFAVSSTDAEYLLFLHRDIEVINSEWLSAMLEHAQRKEVGAVGAKLYYPDDTIQHAGIILGIENVENHPHFKFPRSSHGYFGRINIIQNLSAVTGACMMVCRKVFEEVGGFDERLSHSFNDVDLCLKIREKEYLIVYTPYAELYHHESSSKGNDLAVSGDKARFEKETEFLKTRWKHLLEAGDPYYNPNLVLDKTDFSIRL